MPGPVALECDAYDPAIRYAVVQPLLASIQVYFGITANAAVDLIARTTQSPQVFFRYAIRYVTPERGPRRRHHVTPAQRSDHVASGL
jgi:hypothetical protein